MTPLLILLGLLAQGPAAGLSPAQRTLPAQRVEAAPRIDGRMDEKLWENLPLLTGFTQYMPQNGRPASQETMARIGYDDGALYIGVDCLDTEAARIMRDLRPRDDYGDMNSDLLSVLICPYNDSRNSFYLMVSAAGVQADSKFSGDENDRSWDAVWESAVVCHSYGWSIELRIPFTALRFSSRPVQDWGINIWRWLARNHEWSCWQPVSRDIQGWQKQMGILEGIENLNPPLRLSLTPYFSGYVERNHAENWGHTINSGIDLKYGITESFTLDVTLIPDFGQVQSDDELLNLTPYEIQFSEKRQFFTEGSELFNKGDIYYSRRIGDRPAGYGAVFVEIGDSEEIIANPEETRLINATKVSGRTNGGLGIGFLNAMTAPAYATVKDSLSGEERLVTTQPFTNYNLVVLDQTLFGNSYISLSNSNVTRKAYTANVMAAEFHIADRSQIFRIEGIGALSWIRRENDSSTGFKTYVEAGKYGGKWQIQGILSVISDRYDPNDLGYLRRNNEVAAGMVLSHNIFEPFGPFLSLVNELELTTNRMYRPSAYSDLLLRYSGEASFRNQYSLKWELGTAPLERHDYWETRTPGRFVVLPRYITGRLTAGSDPRQAVAVNVQAGFLEAMKFEFPQRFQEFGINPVVRINDHLNLRFQALYSRGRNQLAYIDWAEKGSAVIFGRHDRRTVENILEASYIFDSKTSLVARVRHYWSAVEYDRFYTLQESGRLGPHPFLEGHDISYNAFNIDMVFRWNFLPGSEILINWKQAIHTKGMNPDMSYWDNLRHTLVSPKTDSLSVKVLYYFDRLPRLFRR